MLAKLTLGITIALLLVPAASAAGTPNPVMFSMTAAPVTSPSGADFAVQFLLMPAIASYLPATEIYFRPCDGLPGDLFSMVGKTRHLSPAKESLAPDKVGELRYAFNGGTVSRPVYLKINFAFKAMPGSQKGAAVTCIEADVWPLGSNQFIRQTQQIALG